MANILLKNRTGTETTYSGVEFISVPSATSGSVLYGADYVKTVTATPSEKDTSIIYNSTTQKYYVWKD